MSNSLLSVIIKIFSWLIMGISALMIVLFYMGIMSENPFIIWAYLLTAIAALLAVLFPVMFFVIYPKNAIKALISLLTLGAVLVIGYILADNSPIVSSVINPDLSNPSVLIYSDMGIIATYILFVVAIVILLYTGIRSIFNR